MMVWLMKVAEGIAAVPTGVGDNCRTNQRAIVDKKIKVKESIYIKKHAPSINHEQGYQLPPIYSQLLTPQAKPSCDRGF